jgi:hypothetical protein
MTVSKLVPELESALTAIDTDPSITNYVIVRFMNTSPTLDTFTLDQNVSLPHDPRGIHFYYTAGPEFVNGHYDGTTALCSAASVRWLAACHEVKRLELVEAAGHRDATAFSRQYLDYEKAKKTAQLPLPVRALHTAYNKVRDRLGM